MSNDVRKQVTDNPLIDQVVYECQTMIKEGVILKMESEALKYETVETIKQADRYADIIEGKSKFEWYEYGLDLLNQVPYLTTRQKVQMAKNNKLIPESAHELLHDLVKKKFLHEYEELNNYYRMLNGMPNIGDEGIKLTDSQFNMIEAIDFDG